MTKASPGATEGCAAHGRIERARPTSGAGALGREPGRPTRISKTPWPEARPGDAKAPSIGQDDRDANNPADFIDATAGIETTEKEIVVRYQRCALKPLLIAAGYGRTETVIPWLERKRLKPIFA
jgi:hypothetical protein